MSKRSCKRKFEKEDEIELEWENKYIISEELRDEMESMWEIPQIFHFLQLTKNTLNTPRLSMYEMERMLLMPKASKQLANIMTCLLSSPNLKSKLHKIPPMPYEFWTNILMHKVRSWFKIYQNKQKNSFKVFESIGVEPEFWNIFPDIFCVEEKDFENLTFKQKVWLLKTLCDTIMHNRKTVQEELSKQSWENKIETILGIDRHGARYIYFPQFLQNDLRVYRHCLDNRILSTVKSPTIKEEPNWEAKDEDTDKCLTTKIGRNKRRKSRWRNGALPYKAKKRKEREKRKKDENLRNSPYNTGSVVKLFTNESRNMSNVSNFVNNNRINYDSITARCSRDISRVSEENSGETKYSFIASLENEDFKGFKKGSVDELNNIPIIYGILDELTSKIEKSLECLEENTLEGISNKQSVEVNKTYCNSTTVTKNLQSVNSGAESISESKGLNGSMISDVVSESDICRDSKKCLSEENMSPIPEIDSKKINEIFSYGISKMNVKTGTTDESTSLKSANEELSERKSVNQDVEMADEDLQNDEIGLDKWLNALSKKKVSALAKEVGGYDPDDKKSLDKSSKSLKKESRCKEISITEKHVELKQDSLGKDNETGSNFESDYESSLIELRDTLINEASFDDFRCSRDNTSEKSKLRNIKLLENESWNITEEDFKELMTDLSVSNFKLVADSVETLRNFIDDFSCKENNSTKSNKEVNTFVPICEVNLLRKLSNLLESVESIEASLKDFTKKARSKLQREWLSFKDGVTEDKDLTGEHGLTTNWWVIGSQNTTLPHTSETTLRPISHSVLSPSGSLPDHSDNECGKQVELQEQEKSKFNDKDENKEREQEESEDGGNESEGTKQQSKRVLRARGISSYTEQLLSDNSDTEELERWTEFEATYSAPSEQSNSTSLQTLSQLEKSDKRSDAEDSDQDWILPSSRKRRNKRSSASRRLKSFQHKLQNMKINSSLSPPPSNTSLEVPDEKNDSGRSNESETKKESRLNISETQKTSTSCAASDLTTITSTSPEKVVSSTNMICKIECADSVHSELDIKDEGPIVDTVANNYNINVQQNYVVVKTEPPPLTNYYVMQQNPPITGVVQGPFMQQTAFVQSAIPQPQHVHSGPSGYYVQSSPSYMVQGPHSGFGAPRHTIGLQPPQQMVIQQTPQIISTQQVLTPPNYVQYMVNNPQQSVVSSSLSNPRMTSPNSHRPNYINSHVQPRGPIMNQHVRMGSRCPQNRMTAPRQNFTHPNGAVIRSMPIAGSGARFLGARNMAPRNIVPRQNLRSVAPRLQRLPKPNAATSTPTSQNTTSLIVLSDSDDEIEMIITEKTNSEANPSVSSPRKNIGQPIQRRKPVVTSEVTVSNPKSTLPPQIVQRMSQGGISITPVKTTPPPPPSNANTQLVVVVNETGSHYALALPNGSKLILTPEQVAQIRASNGGKLIL